MGSVEGVRATIGRLAAGQAIRVETGRCARREPGEPAGSFRASLALTFCCAGTHGGWNRTATAESFVENLPAPLQSGSGTGVSRLSFEFGLRYEQRDENPQ